MLHVGDPLSSLLARSSSNPAYSIDSVAGRHIVLSFVATTRAPGVQAYLDALYRSGDLFDDSRACCFIVINDPQDEAAGLLQDRYPGIRVLWDMDHALAERFGCVVPAGDHRQIQLTSIILDPGLRVSAVLPFEAAQDHFAIIDHHVRALPHPQEERGCAPVLQVPNILEPELCREMIAYALRTGLEDSGYMRTNPVDGRTVMTVNHGHKKRSDCSIDDDGLRGALQARIRQRLVPQIERAFQFKATRMERYIVARYDAETGGWFRPHKDNTTMGTAHRRFAVSINLNAEDFTGGELRFPEFGPRTYRPSTGGAVVFSCSLLHEATPILSGTRYCTLPFLYDDAAAQVRLNNARYLDDPQLRESVVQSVLARP